MAALRYLLGPALGLGLLLVGACGDDGQTAPAPRRSAQPAQSADQALAPGLVPAFDLVNEGRFDAARERVERYLTSNGPAGVNVYQAEFLLGYSYQKQKLYQQARDHLLRAVELQPDYHASYHFLGFAHYYLGDLDDARSAFEAHLRFRPDEGDNHFGIGLCDLDTGRLDLAEQRFTRAIELHVRAAARGRDRRPEIAKSRARLGDVYELRGELSEARHEYEQAATTWPAHLEVWHKLYRVLLRQGEDELAEEALRQGAEWRARARSADAPPP
jgi:tetratricopeptide (TPR) repeat protein